MTARDLAEKAIMQKAVLDLLDGDCGHPFHGLKVCDDCGCPRPSIPLGGS